MKRFLPIVFALLWLSAFAQPANDDCPGSVNIVINPLTKQGIVTGVSNALATASANPANSPTPACLNATLRDVWFQFTTPAGGALSWEIKVTASTPSANPEFELYRSIPGLGCANLLGVQCKTNSPTVGNTVFYIANNLTAGITYYVRVNHWGAATSMGFDVEVKEYIPPITLNGAADGGTSTKCNGTMYDSGGPTGNYGAGENFDYKICPTTPHSCVVLDVTYQFEACVAGLPPLDRLEVYAGALNNPTPAANAANLIQVISDQGSVQVTVPDSCVTVRMVSDGAVQAQGFKLDWACTSSCPPPPAKITCSNAAIVPALPYTQSQLSTCGGGNTYNSSDACGSTYMDGEDYVFAYTTNQKKCISISLTNTSTDVGLFLLNSCPNNDAAACLAAIESAAGNPFIPTIELPDSGTYYIVVSSAPGCSNCTGFDISITDAPCALDVDPNVTDSVLVETIAAQGVQIANVSLNCPQGAYGTFTGGLVAKGEVMDAGIILSTGIAEDAEGPNILNGTSTSLGTPGDPLLNQISGVTTQDACILEFDVYAPDDVLSFDYIFASEEYLEWVNSGFNDVFAFLLSGPGIVGQKNLAFIPNTTTPITINTVNNNTNNQYYVNNPIGSLITEYDGYTAILEAVASVIPCNWYHVRLAIADGTDNFFDSAVFLEANSLFSNISTISESGADFNGQINAAEGCANGQFAISLLGAQSQTTYVPIKVGGTATNGVDFAINIPDTLVFAPGQQTVIIPIQPTVDGISEGVETVTIYLFSQCDTVVPFDSATIIIRDELRAAMPTTLDICGAPVALPLTATGAEIISWSPATGLSATNVLSPIASPQTTTTYTVQLSNGVCDTSLQIEVRPIYFQTSGDATICVGGSVQTITNTNVDPTLATFSWTPTAGVSDPTKPSPLITPQNVGNNIYVLEFNYQGCQARDTVFIFAAPSPVLNLIANTTLCEGESIQLADPNAPTNIPYVWTENPAGSTLNDPTIGSPTATPTQTTTYTVTSNNGVCPPVSASVTINVGGNFSLDVVIPDGGDTTIYQGDVTPISVTANPDNANPIGNVSYSWTPPTALTNPNAANTNASPVITTTYTVTATSDAGCEGQTQVTVEVLPPDFGFPNAFTPTGNNQYFKLEQLGNVTILEFKIYDRWGGLVFNNENPNGWDGTHNGKALPQHTYVYYAIVQKPNGEQIRLNGEVLLIR